MDCGNCGKTNPDGAKFCLNCGNGLAPACPSCKTELPPEAKFCLNCGHRMVPKEAAPTPAPERLSMGEAPKLQQFIPEALLQKMNDASSGGDMQGERRVVTMLFADVKGSTAAAENLDPEEWADIMNGAYERFIAPVFRYEGTLARLMGDAILAFFGAPISHEDDPERGVLAALDILHEVQPYLREVKRDWGIDIDVRIGLNTGLVVVGAMGSDLRLEYTAMGDAVNLAARMEQTAAPGTVQITDETHKSVANLFEFEPIGDIEVKGKSEAITAYRVLGPKTRPRNDRGIAGLDAPMVGRDAELAILRTAFGGLAGGKGHVVSLIAEAGLGKSRLMAEWHHSHERDGELERVGWYEGRSLSYETAEPYAPLKGIFKQLLGLTPAPGSSLPAYEALHDALRRFYPTDAEGPAAYLASMLGLTLTGDAAHRVRYLQPPELQQKIFGCVLETLARAAAEEPLVLVFEDLHWADTMSLELARSLQALTERAPVLLVALFRPRRQEASWSFHEEAERERPHLYDAIRLQPLDDEEARTLVRALLAVDGLADSVRDLICQRAEGNPFFVEEVIRTLLDAGKVVQDGDTWRATEDINEIEVPETLTGVLTTRLDKLSDAHRKVAQVAAVIGREFDFQTLAAVASDPVVLNEALSELQRRGLLREVSRVPVRRFRFKHGLTRDAAYDTLLLKHRRALHLTVAEHWERVEADRVPEIASHFLAGRKAERALPYLVQAGEQAATAHAIPEALAWFEKATEILDPGTHLELARRAYEGVFNSRKLTFDLDGAISAADTLIQLGETHQAPGMRISGLNKKGFALAMFTGDLETGGTFLQKAEALANESEETVGLLECEMYQCYLNTGVGKFDKVESYMRDVKQKGEAIGAEEPTFFGMAHLASALMSLTRYDEAFAQAKETLDYAQRMGNRFWASEMMCWVVPQCHLRNGELDEAMAIAQRGTELAERIGAPNEAAMGYCTQAQIALMRGDFDDAVALNQKFLENAEATGMPYLIPLAHCTLGSTFIQMGGAELGERALPSHRQAMDLMEAPLGGVHTTWLCTEVGFCTLSMGLPEKAGEYFETALTVPNASMHILKPRALLGQALASLDVGEVPRAREKYEAAESIIADREMRHFLPELHRVGARVAEADGNSARALECADACETLARDWGLKPALYQSLAHRARLQVAEGDSDGARASRDEARGVIDALAAGVADEALRAGFRRFAEAQLPEL